MKYSVRSMGCSDVQHSFIYGTRHSMCWRFLCPLPFQTTSLLIFILNTGLWTKYNSEISEIVTEIFRPFPQSLQTNSWTVPLTGSCSLPSKSLPFHIWAIILSFDTTHSKLRVASLNVTVNTNSQTDNIHACAVHQR